MPVVCLIVLMLCLGLAHPASAQTWQDADRAGDYERAADLLREIVGEPEFVITGRNPEPIRRLAHYYAEGLGVSRDPILACALAQDAAMATQSSPWPRPMLTLDDAREFQAWLKESEDYAAAACANLSEPEMLAAMRARGGCYAFGLSEQLVTIGDQRMHVGRLGIMPEGAKETSADLMCPLYVARARVRSLEPPENAAPGVAARHFVEMLAWRRSRDPRGAATGYTLSCQVFEVRRRSVQILVDEVLLNAPVRPTQLLPDGTDRRLTLEMIRSGHVRWRIDGAPPRRGWLMLPDPEEGR